MRDINYTVPIFEGFAEDAECPFCSIYYKIESDVFDYVLGTSYMEDDVRMLTNEKGFCKAHYELLLTSSNRLGVALITHTHTEKINKDISPLLNKIKIAITKSNKKKNGMNENEENIKKENEKKEDDKSKRGIFKRSNKNDASNNLINYLDTVLNSCFMCENINNRFYRIIDNFFHLYKKGDEMKGLVVGCKGFCLQHFRDLLFYGEKCLNRETYNDFLSIAIPLQEENLKRLEEEVSWFIDKFDYRYTKEPWKNSKDSPQRLINKLSSLKVDK